MPKYRKLYVKTVESLDLNEMPDDTLRLFWVLLPTQLCREGRGLDNPAWIKSRVFPLRQDITAKDVGAMVDWLDKNEMIVRYEVEGRKYFYVPTFHKYQGDCSRETESDFPAPSDNNTPEQVKSKSRVNQDEDESKVLVAEYCILNNESASESVKDKKTKKKSKPPPLTANEILELVPLPDEFAYSLEFTSTWTNFIEHRIELGKPFKKRGAQMALNRLSKYELGIAIAAMQDSISNGWQGLFPDKVNTQNGKGASRRKSQAELRQEASDKNIQDIVRNIAKGEE